MSVPETPDKACTVSQLTQQVKISLEESPYLQQIWVRGEISNLNYNSSGHIYFTLRDENAQLSVSFFKNYNRELDFRLQDGMSVVVFGSVNVYAKMGRYQLVARSLQKLGVGDIRQKVEELRRQLFREGLFAPERKVPLPAFPRRIGVATSATGAAFRDIYNVCRQRNPSVELVLAPCQVQGDTAGPSIVRAIEELQNEHWGIDLIIVGRGGGSFEDLLCFSDEAVVRAIAACRLPVISAVGHEIDHPISDDAADLAAPTPSAAMQRAVPDLAALEQQLFDLGTRLGQGLKGRYNSVREFLRYLCDQSVWQRPRRFIEEKSQYLDELSDQLDGAARQALVQKQNQLDFFQNLGLHFNAVISAARNRFELAAQRLDNFSPLATLKRGYSLVSLKGAPVQSAKDLKAGDELDILWSWGRGRAVLSEVEEKPFDKIVP